MRISWLLVVAVVVPTAVLAQQMDEGEARITARSDVRVEIATGPGTRRNELEGLGGAVGSRMNRVRQCYGERVEVDPTVQGTMTVTVTAARGGRATVEVTEGNIADAQLRSCALGALGSADVSGSRAGAAVLVTLTFTNTAAEGHARTRQGRAVEARSTGLERLPDGKLGSRGATEDGVVTYRVVGPEASRDGILQVHQGVRSAVAGLLDCRRRATRLGDGPEGEVRAELTVAANGRGRVSGVNSTVAHRLAGPCVQGVLQRASYERSARGRYTVIIENAPLAPE